LGHACVRTYQLLRAPSVLHESDQLRAAAGERHLETGLQYELLSPVVRGRLYWLALERFHLDTFLDHYVVAPVVRVGTALENMERRIFTKPALATRTFRSSGVPYAVGNSEVPLGPTMPRRAAREEIASGGPS